MSWRRTAAWVLLVAALAPGVAAQVVVTELGAPQTVQRGETTILTWQVQALPSAGEVQVRALLALPDAAGSPAGNWEATLEPAQFTLGNGETRILRATVVADVHPSPRTAQLQLHLIVATSRAIADVYSNHTLHATGTSLILDTFQNPLPAPLDGPAGAFILDILAWLAVAAIARYLLEPMARLVARRTKTTFDDDLVGLLGTPLLAFIFVFGLRQSLEVLDLSAGLFRAIERGYKLVTIALVVFLLYRVLNAIVRTFGRRHTEHTGSQLDDRLVPVFEKVGGVLVFVGGLFYAVASFGVNLTYFAAGGVLVTTVIAFAAQDTLSNFFGGIFLLIDQPFREGDEIMIESGEVCTVQRIGLRSTQLYHRPNHHVIILPNNQLASKRVTNLVRPDRLHRMKVTVGVAYDSDPAKVSQALVEVALNHKAVLRGGGHDPTVRLEEFRDSYMLMSVGVWIGDVMDRNRVASELRVAMLARFAKDGIDIPLPHQVVVAPRERGARESAAQEGPEPDVGGAPDVPRPS